MFRPIADNQSSQPENLVMLPREYGYDSSRIYVTSETKRAFLEMIRAAEKDGIFFKARSGYRGFWYQKKIFERRMKEGKSFGEVVNNVAPPGYSEHMLGTALDMVTDTRPFGLSAAYRWLKNNGGKFGFIESYPKDSQAEFSWEPWHWNYVGNKTVETYDKTLPDTVRNDRDD
jgi:D-alanyl-D-alanine carboxypeptidase